MNNMLVPLTSVHPLSPSEAQVRPNKIMKNSQIPFGGGTDEFPPKNQSPFKTQFRATMKEDFKGAMDQRMSYQEQSNHNHVNPSSNKVISEKL